MIRALYILWQCTWGFVQTLIGFIGFLSNRRSRHYFYHGAVITEWDHPYSTSVGLFVFLSSDPMRDRKKPDENAFSKTLVHEYGHTIQSLILGPLYMIVIGVPSSVWFLTPGFRKYREEKNVSYFSFYTEKWANFCGEKVTGEKSMGQALI